MKFRRLATSAGLPEGVKLHSIRATFANRLRDKGVDIYTVSKLLGHPRVKVTEKYYLAENPDLMKEAVELLEFGHGLLSGVAC